MTGECYSFDAKPYTVKRLGGNVEESKNEVREADPQCPLKKIWCFVGEMNIYANNQEVEIPELLRFDLENSDLWVPFKEKDDEDYAAGDYQEPMSMQPEKLKYYPDQPYEMRLTELEQRLTKYLKDKFAEQRLQDTKKMINWNVDFEGSEELYKLLTGDVASADIDEIRDALEYSKR